MYMCNLIGNLGMIRSFLSKEDGGVAIISAVAMVGMIGTAGLALEYGNALLSKTTAQRAIDLAVYSAAVEYSESGDSVRMKATAASVLRTNGVDSVTLNLVLDGDTLLGTVGLAAPLGLTRVIRDNSSVDINVSATALLGPGEPACLVALDSEGTGINLRGGTTAEARNCATASAASVEATCGTKIVTTSLTYGSSSPPDICEWTTNVVKSDGEPAPIERKPATNPMADDPAIAKRAFLLAEASDPFPGGLASLPNSSGPDIDFSSTGNAKKIQDIRDEVASVPGCEAERSGSTWTVKCSGTSTHAFGEVEISGGASLNFVNESNSPDSQFLFQRIIHNGSQAEFGPGSYRITDGLTVNSLASFVSGMSFEIGAQSQNANAISVGGGATLNIGSDSVTSPSFKIDGNISVGGNGTLTMGPGSGLGSNFEIDGNIDIGGSGTLIMGSRTDAGSTFRIDGNIDTNGNSCFVLGAANEHFINGAIEAKGAGIFGEGIYAITGYVNFGTGGSSPCNGQQASLNAENVTFLIGGNNVPSNGNTCNRSSFCIGAGARNAVISAPNSGVFSNIAVMGPVNGSSGDATFAGGARDTSISGVLYFPEGRLTLSGGASVAGGTGGCLQLIAAEIELSGGTSAISDCLSGAGSQITQVRLIQ